MTNPTTEAARPSLDEVRSAVEILTRAWAPPPVLTPALEGTDLDDVDLDYYAWDDYYGSGEYEWTNGCNCGGADIGEVPSCNCGANCGCKSCVHYDQARYKTCSVRECGQPTQLKITPWCLHRDDVSRAADAGDPAANEMGSVALGDSCQSHSMLTACGTIHARQLITADQDDRAKFPADSALSADRTHYDVGNWTYEPDEIDVPGAIHRAADRLGSAARWARTTVQASYPLDARHRDFALEGVEQNLVEAAAALLEYRDHLAAQAAADDGH